MAGVPEGCPGPRNLAFRPGLLKGSNVFGTVGGVSPSTGTGATGPWLDPELLLAVGSPTSGACKVWLGLGSDWGLVRGFRASHCLPARLPGLQRALPGPSTF